MTSNCSHPRARTSFIVVGRNKAWFIFVTVYFVWLSGRRRRHLQIRSYSQTLPSGRAFCRPAAAGESMPLYFPVRRVSSGPLRMRCPRVCGCRVFGDRTADLCRKTAAGPLIRYCSPSTPRHRCPIFRAARGNRRAVRSRNRQPRASWGVRSPATAHAEHGGALLRSSFR